MDPFANLLIDTLGRRKNDFGWRGGQGPLNLAEVDNVCLLQPNHKLGDAILISLLVDALAQARPGLRLYVATSSEFAPYWECHPAVSRAIVLDPGKRFALATRIGRGWREAKAWRGRLDVAISFQPYARAEHFALLRYLGPQTLIGFNKETFRLFDYSLEEHRQGVDLAPIATRARSVMRVFGLDVDVRQLRAHAPFVPADEALVNRTLSVLPRGPRVLVNVYGATHSKRLSPDSTRRVVREIRRSGYRGAVVVSAPLGEEREYEALLREERGDSPVAVIGPQSGIGPLCALVAAMDVVISPDTAVGHVAAAFGKPQVCLFGRRGSVPITWRPLNDRCLTLVPSTGENVNDVDWSEFAEAVRQVLSHAGLASLAWKNGVQRTARKLRRRDPASSLNAIQTVWVAGSTAMFRVPLGKAISPMTESVAVDTTVILPEPGQ